MQPAEIRQLLSRAGLRPTRQRLQLAELIFAEQHHFSAESLQKLATEHEVFVSLATVYNTLNNFSTAGLLKRIAVNGGRTYFDSNTHAHQHFFIEESESVLDIDDRDLAVTGVPTAPPGYEIVAIDVVVRLRRLDTHATQVATTDA